MELAGRVKKRPKQIEAVLQQKADIFVLREVIETTHSKRMSSLLEAGYHAVGSFDFVEDKSNLNGGRKYGVIIAAKWEFDHIQPDQEMVP